MTYLSNAAESILRWLRMDLWILAQLKRSSEFLEKYLEACRKIAEGIWNWVIEQSNTYLLFLGIGVTFGMLIQGSLQSSNRRLDLWTELKGASLKILTIMAVLTIAVALFWSMVLPALVLYLGSTWLYRSGRYLVLRVRGKAPA